MISAAYTGPPPLTGEVAMTSWQVDYVMLGVALVAGGGYLAAVATLRRRGTKWPLGRSVLFLGAGLGSLVLATASFLNVYADPLIWARTVQLTVLFLLTPLFLAMGRPLTLAAAVLPTRHHARARRMLHSRPARVLAFPLLGSGLLMALPWFVLFTPWATAMLLHEVVDDATRLLLLAVGFLYYWTRLQLDPVPARYPSTVSLFIAFAEVVLNIALGLLLILGVGEIARAYYVDLARPWGPSPLLDQQLAGGAYWLIGHAAGVPFLIFAFRQAKRDDDLAAAEIDAVLDAATAAAPRSAAPDNDPSLPWWQTDPRFASARRPMSPPAPRGPDKP